MRDIRIKRVKPEDAEELLSIYGPYVEETAITFEYEVPTREEFADRIRTISASYPYIKAVDEETGRILGYAYATSFKSRKAYDWSVETTIYMRPEARRMGLGSALYIALENALSIMGVLNLNACIAVPKGEDPHLTMDSPLFHEKLGYRLVGTFHDSGYKFNTWYDMIWMEKMIGEHTASQEPVRFGEWDIPELL